MTDRGQKKRSKFHKTTFKGTSHGMSKLTEKQVLEIRATYKPGLGAKLAKKFKVHLSAINAIIHYKTWKHVP